MRGLVSLPDAAVAAQRDLRTVQRWVQQRRLATYSDGTGGRLVELREVMLLERDVRQRMENRQRQRLVALLGDLGEQPAD